MLFDMEIDMKKKLNIDVSDWGLPKLAKKIDKLQNKYENKIEKISKTLLDDVFSDFDHEYGKLAIIVREAASEALNLSLEDSAQIDLLTKPGKAIFCLPFCDQFPEWEIDIKEHIVETVSECLDRDHKYIGVSWDKEFRELSTNLKAWAAIIDDCLDPEIK